MWRRPRPRALGNNPDLTDFDVDAPRGRGAPSLRGRAQPDVLAVIALGGALGALGRYAVSRAIHVSPDTFPWATFVTNIAGAFALGLFMTLVIERFPPSRYLRPFFAIGFLGAFTTFSTMALETVTLVKDGDALLGVAYLLASVASGLAVTYVGIVLARIPPARRARARQ
jgi:CrcB protein